MPRCCSISIKKLPLLLQATCIYILVLLGLLEIQTQSAASKLAQVEVVIVQRSAGMRSVYSEQLSVRRSGACVESVLISSPNHANCVQSTPYP
jgi:hypothetical protein